MSKTQIPDEALFYIAEGYYSTDQVLRVIYSNPSARTREHFLSVNSHLKGGRVTPGQMVIITPPDAKACAHWEAVMQEAAHLRDAQLARLSEQERKNLARHYALLSDVTDYTAPMLSWANNSFARRAKHVEQILQQIDRLYVTTYNAHGHLHTEHFFAQRRALFAQLNQTINGMMRREMFGVAASPGQLKSQLGISSKATVHQWKAQGGADSIKGFSSNYQRLTQTAKVFSRLGYVSIGLEIAGGVANIKEACSLDPGSGVCRRAKFTETGKTAGSIGVGAFGGYAAYGACNLLFGVETAGTSLLWCGIFAGGAGSYTGSKLGGKAGAMVGEKIYETTAP